MKKFIAILVLILALISISIFVFFNHPSSSLSENEKEKALEQILGRKPNLTDTSPKGNTVFNGKYVTFTYPAAAKIYIPQVNGQVVKSTDLESFIFDLDSPKIAFFMEVSPVPSRVQSVSDYPGVRLRQVQSDAYKQKSIVINGIEGLAFEKISVTSNELTAFFYKNGKVYSFSVQGNDPKSMEEVFNSITATVKFL